MRQTDKCKCAIFKDGCVCVWTTIELCYNIDEVKDEADARQLCVGSVVVVTLPFRLEEE